MKHLQQNLANIKQQLAASGARLVAVSKTQPAEAILEAYQAGQRIFGENKVQEMAAKYELLPKDIEWHLIGHLQSNKVKYIAAFVNMIHSADSLKLLQEINRQAAKHQRVIDCLLQVHIAEEEHKFGFSEQEVSQLLHSGELAPLTNIHIRGLMGMATNTEDQQKIRAEFVSLKKLYEALRSSCPAASGFEELSMGMSNDFRLAIEEGSTLVRIGSALFN